MASEGVDRFGNAVVRVVKHATTRRTFSGEADDSGLPPEEQRRSTRRNPMEQVGSMIYGEEDGAEAELGPPTADDQVIGATAPDGNGDRRPVWRTESGGSPIAALDDVPDVNTPAPGDGDVLTWDSTPGEWVALPPGSSITELDDVPDVNAPSPSDGDLLAWDATPGEWVALPPAGASIEVDGAFQAGGVTTFDWNDDNFNIGTATPGEVDIQLGFGIGADNPARGNHTHAQTTGFTVNLGDGLTVLTTAEPFVLVQIPFAATITGVHLNADAAGTLTLDIGRAAAGTPTAFTSIVAAAPPTLAGPAQSSSDTTLTGWTTAVTAGDWLKIAVTGTPTVVKRVGCALVLVR